MPGLYQAPHWHLGLSPVPRRHPVGPREADGAGGAILPAAGHLRAALPPRTGHRPPGPQAKCVRQRCGGGGGPTPVLPGLTSLCRQLLGDQEDAGEDRGPGAGAAEGSGWSALGVSGAMVLLWGGHCQAGVYLACSPGRSVGHPASWPQRCWTARDMGCPQMCGPWAVPCKQGPGGWVMGAPSRTEQPDPPPGTWH